MMACGQLAAAAAVFGLAYADSNSRSDCCCASPAWRPARCRLILYAVAQMFAGPRAAGTWVGIQNAIGNLSGIFGPIITGVIVDRAGYNTAFVVTAAVAAAGALWWVVGVPRIQQVELD